VRKLSDSKLSTPWGSLFWVLVWIWGLGFVCACGDKRVARPLCLTPKMTFSRAALRGEIRAQRVAVQTHEEQDDDDPSLGLSPVTKPMYNPTTASAAVHDDQQSHQSVSADADIVLPGTPQHADKNLTNDSLKSSTPTSWQDSRILDDEEETYDFFDESLMSSIADESWSGTRGDGLLSNTGLFF